MDKFVGSAFGAINHRDGVPKISNGGVKGHRRLVEDGAVQRGQFVDGFLVFRYDGHCCV